MQPLRDYQARATTAVRQHWANGVRRVLLVSPTGSGKTRMGEELAVPFGRVVWFAHRKELIGDASRRLAAALGPLEVGVIAPGVSPSPYSRVQVATVQTALARNVRPPADLVVIDECFPGWVTVDGRRIDSLQAGDLVSCVDHSTGELTRKPIARVMRRESDSTVKIFTDGRFLECTGNHPVFVKGKGYVQAKDIVSGDLLCVRGAIRGKHAGRREDAEDLRRQVPREALIGNYDAHEPGSRQPENDRAQPNAAPSVAPEDASNTTQHGTRSESQRREWEASDAIGAGSFRSDWMADECDRSYGATGERVADSLQAGRGQLEASDSDRSGRSEPWLTGAPGAGSKERGILVWERVGRIARHQCASSIPVWNLEVEGAHTYFAGGVLVHNCHHIVADDWNKVLDAYPYALILLLTATPERQDGRGLSEVADVMVVAAEYSELLAAGHLTSVRVFRPEQILGNALAQDPVDAWLRHSEGSPGFAFFGSVKMAYETEHRLNERGVRSATVEQSTARADRARYIEQLGSGELDCICNVYTMTEGVDVPRARVCMLASACNHCGGYLQKTGRVVRPHESKPNAILIDLVGASILHGLPTEDRVYSLDGEPIKRRDVQPLKSCPSCGATIHAAYTACPECQWAFAPEKAKRGPRIYSLELVEVFAGKETPIDAKRAEYAALRKLQKTNGYDLYFVRKKYKELFGEDVFITDATNDEKRKEYAKLQTLAKSKGFRPGFVKVRFKETFGHWPT